MCEHTQVVHVRSAFWIFLTRNEGRPASVAILSYFRLLLVTHSIVHKLRGFPVDGPLPPVLRRASSNCCCCTLPCALGGVHRRPWVQLKYLPQLELISLGLRSAVQRDLVGVVCFGLARLHRTKTAAEKLNMLVPKPLRRVFVNFHTWIENHEHL